MVLSNGKKFKMNPKDKKQWIEALLSGKYKKQRFVMGSGKYRCVLGVLCAEKMTTSVFGKFVPNSYLPSEVQRIVSRMNDRNVSFKKIALWIEENL